MKSDVTTRGDGSSSPASGRALDEHLQGVDGLRGCAALLIFAYHLYGSQHSPQWRPIGAVNWLRLLDDGWIGVNLFLVISGFCLSLPFFRNPQRPFRFRAFMTRRVRRIVPAYYASLLLLPLLSGLIERVTHLPVWTRPHGWLDIVLHLSLLHSLWFKSFHSIGGVYWTLSLEWLWYLWFPVALYFWRKKGPLWAFAMLAIITFSYRIAVWQWFQPDATLSPQLEADRIFAWRSALPGQLIPFGLGMGVAWSFVNRSLTRSAVWIAVVALIGGLLLGRAAHKVSSFLPVIDGFYGLSCAALLFLVVAPMPNLTHRFFTSRPLIFSGKVSYSLYLYHLPLCLLLQPMAAHYGYSPQFYAASLLLMTPPLLGLSWVLYALFEKPFFQPRPPREVQADLAPTAMAS